jgi:hypothetical protein
MAFMNPFFLYQMQEAVPGHRDSLLLCLRKSCAGYWCSVIFGTVTCFMESTWILLMVVSW